MHEIITLPVGQMAANCYIVGSVIIDPGDDAEYIMSHCRENPTLIIATHGHFDHIMAAFAIQKTYNIPVYLHHNDEFLVKRMNESAKHFLGITTDPPPDITPVTRVSYGGLKVVHTPGHTPGSICLVSKGMIFTGDTIFAGGGVGRTEHGYSSPEDLRTSITAILKYSAGTVMYPGHGEPSTVGKERAFHIQ